MYRAYRSSGILDCIIGCPMANCMVIPSRSDVLYLILDANEAVGRKSTITFTNYIIMGLYVYGCNKKYLQYMVGY